MATANLKQQAFPAKLNPRPAPDNISLRDWFAGMALQGLIAMQTPQDMDNRGFTLIITAEWAYRYADAMLKARTRD